MKTKIIALILLILMTFTSCDILPPSDSTEGSSSGFGEVIGSLLSKLDDIISGLNPTEKPDGDVVASEGHVDEDNDGYCDECGEYVIIILDFYAINDLHGKLADTDSNVGADELTTYLKAQMALDDNAVLLSSGDMWQGSSESNMTHGLIMTEWMNDLGFVSMTMGNHEYDWGDEYINANACLAEFPLLAINIFDKTTNQRVDYCDASVVVERSGLKIGIIGAIGDCYSSISSDMTSGIYFKTGKELSALIKAESERLREDEDVDFVVLSLHDGNESGTSSEKFINASSLSGYYDATLSNGYVDVVFEGHTHKSYIYFDNQYVYHMQAGGENKGISHIEFSVNFANGKNSVNTAEIVKSSTYERYESDSIVDTLLKKYESAISPAYEVLGTLSRNVYSNELCDLVAQLYYEKGKELWGDKYDIVVGGGFISARSPYQLNRGDVTYSDIYSVMPFDNSLVLCSISGKDLKRVFLETTNSRYHVYKGDISDVVDTATYYIVTDTYTSTYRSNNLTEIVRFEENVFARDLIADYISDGKLN